MSPSAGSPSSPAARASAGPAGDSEDRRLADAPAGELAARDNAEARRVRDARLAAYLAAAAGGDTRAFEGFYDATFAYARTVARRLLRDAAAIEDLLADCYFEAWRTAARFDPSRGSPVTWLLTLVRSRGIDALRAEAARPDRVVQGAPGIRPAAEGGAGTPCPDPTAPDADLLDSLDGSDDRADPADRLWRRQAGARLQAALALLDPAERWVIGLAYLRELSQTEIACCTGMPLGTVKSHALRAQQKLRSLLNPTVPYRAGSAGPQR